MSCKCRPNSRHPCRPEKCYHGATHYSPLCPSFPHFEVTILETGRTHWPGIGVVPTGYSETVMPGWEKQSLGYHTDDGKIYHSSAQLRYDYFGHDTEGHRMARRGDLIRCTAMFEHRANGKVPICFTLNGEKIVTTGDPTSSFSVPCSSLYPYLALSDGCSVLVKICCEENEEYNAAKFAEIKKELEETNRKLEETSLKVVETNLKVEETNLKLDKIMGFIADLRQGESFPVA
ncbi:uncharacterized protein [Montipora capricornis]|uniref:uncharacterized protein n=1 Tax=Montipora capricornis TaxID=246305 RepID=UPI0035F17633